MNIPFVGPTYNLDDRPASVQRTINLMPLPNEIGNERAGWVFKDVPGLAAFVEPVPPITGYVTQAFGTGDYTGSTAFDSTVAAQIQAGDLLTLFTIYNKESGLGAQFPTWPAGYTEILDVAASSSGALRANLRGRVATGTAADTVVPLADTVQAHKQKLFYEYAIVRNGPTSVNGIPFPDYFGYAGGQQHCYGTSGFNTPPSVTPLLTGYTWLNLVICCSGDSYYPFTGVSSGYTLTLDGRFTVQPFAVTVYAQIMMGRSVNTAATEHPGAFSFSGSPGNDGSSYLIRIPYTP